MPEPAALGKQEVVKTSRNEIFLSSLCTFPGPRSFRLFPALRPEAYILLLFAARMKGDTNPVFWGGRGSFPGCLRALQGLALCSAAWFPPPGGYKGVFLSGGKLNRDSGVGWGWLRLSERIRALFSLCL